MKRNQWLPVDGFNSLRVGQYIVPNFAANSTAVCVAEDHWLIISPGAPLVENWQYSMPGYAGRISLILPNAYHYMGTEKWLEAYPHADVYASCKAIKRLAKKGLAPIKELEEDPPALPATMRILIPPGHRGGDIWLEVTENNKTAWITCDSFLNYERLSNQAVARTLQRLLGTAPGLRIGEVIRWFIIDQRHAFKEWVLKQLLQSGPSTLIPGHGEVYQSAELSRELERLVKERL